MKKEELFLKKDEQVLFKIRTLFEQYGYRKFKMSKFEEYDFYADNRSFLNCESILTFTGRNGRLLALKPDITLSIVKTSKADRNSSERVYYTENVYRARKDSDEFREIMQAGIEYIGNADICAEMEVLMLAKECMELTEEDYLITLSHMGFIKGLMDSAGFDERQQKEALSYLSSRNLHSLEKLCRETETPPEFAEKLKVLLSLYGNLGDVLPELRKLCCNKMMEDAADEFEQIYSFLDSFGAAGRFFVDFSIVNDMDYYNGIIFQGYIKEIPDVVLSGGRYDNIVQKMNKDADAIGFAFAVDLLAELSYREKDYDIDVLLIYGDDTDPVALMQAASMFRENGQSVMTSRNDSGNIKYRQLIRMKERGLEIVTE